MKIRGTTPNNFELNDIQDMILNNIQEISVVGRIPSKDPKNRDRPKPAWYCETGNHLEMRANISMRISMRSIASWYHFSYSHIRSRSHIQFHTTWLSQSPDRVGIDRSLLLGSLILGNANAGYIVTVKHHNSKNT